MASPSVLQVRDAYWRAIEGMAQVSAVRVSPDDQFTLQVLTRTGGRHTLDLTRLIDELRSTELEARGACFDNGVAALLEVLRADLPAATRSDLIPTIKHIEWARAVVNAGVVAMELAGAGELAIVFAFDRAHSFAFATMTDLDRLGLSFDDCLSLATDNLRARLPDTIPTIGDGKSSLFTTGGNHEASIILLPEVWDQVETELVGEIVICVPSRDVCIFTSTGTPGGVESLLAARARGAGDQAPGHPISSALFVRRSKRWEPYANQA